jgi:hypothetical protein
MKNLPTSALSTLLQQFSDIWKPHILLQSSNGFSPTYMAGHNTFDVVPQDRLHSDCAASRKVRCSVRFFSSSTPSISSALLSSILFVLTYMQTIRKSMAPARRRSSTTSSCGYLCAWTTLLAGCLQIVCSSTHDKTELLWCMTARRLDQLPSAPMRIELDHIEPSSKVRNLGIFLDSDLAIQSHIQREVAGCFPVLRQLRSVRQSVPTAVYQTFVNALVLPKLDNGNATLAGLPAYQYGRVQSVLNAAARSIAELRRSDHVADALASFHWLRVPEPRSVQDFSSDLPCTTWYGAKLLVCWLTSHRRHPISSQASISCY